MKKLFTILLISIFVLGISNKSFSQNMDHRSTISANVGVSLIATILEAAIATDENGASREGITHIPAVQFNYDFAVLKFLTVGGGISYESISLTGTGTDANGVTYTANVSASVMNFAARALFHYANSGRLDLYSGVRMGYEVAGFSASITDGTESAYTPPANYGFMAPQLVLFGFRGYFTDNFGASAELAIGWPHFFTVGLNYRF